MAGSGVTQEADGRGNQEQRLPVAGNGVTPDVSMPEAQPDGGDEPNGTDQPNGTEAINGAGAPASGAGYANGAASGIGHPGVRRRLGRFASARGGGGVNPVLEPLIKTARTTHPKADIRQIERAHEVAARGHDNQSRKSGDPYITHPLAVATILAELGMNHETLCAALLHDKIGDTHYTLDELRGEFGDE